MGRRGVSLMPSRQGSLDFKASAILSVITSDFPSRSPRNNTLNTVCLQLFTVVCLL